MQVFMLKFHYKLEYTELKSPDCHKIFTLFSYISLYKNVRVVIWKHKITL